MVELGITVLEAQPVVLTIDEVDPGSSLFVFDVGINASWTKAVGKLVDIAVDIANEGEEFANWTTLFVYGGPVTDKAGNAKDSFRLAGEWPGVHDGSGKAYGRRPVVPKRLRVTMSPHQRFGVSSLQLQVK